PEVHSIDDLDRLYRRRRSQQFPARAVVARGAPSRGRRITEGQRSLRASMSDKQNVEGVRLQKVLARAGVASRRGAEELIAQGRVSVDGETVREQGRRVDPERAVIKVDGRRIEVRSGMVYLALNKPAGVHTTM